MNYYVIFVVSTRCPHCTKISELLWYPHCIHKVSKCELLQYPQDILIVSKCKIFYGIYCIPKVSSLLPNANSYSFFIVFTQGFHVVSSYGIEKSLFLDGISYKIMFLFLRFYLDFWVSIFQILHC